MFYNGLRETNIILWPYQDPEVESIRVDATSHNHQDDISWHDHVKLWTTRTCCAGNAINTQPVIVLYCTAKGS